MKDIKQQECERADELVSFLYGELGDQESRRFARHLHECGRCTAEFKVFGQIRNSILTWRNESLGAASAPATAMVEMSGKRPSALAAIREFFTLSPLWMKGATVCASLLFCVCAVLAFVYLKGREPTIMAVQSEKIYTQQDLDARVALEKQKVLESQRQTDSSNILAVNEAPKAPRKRHAVTGTIGYVANSRNWRKPLTKQERQELASDLGLLGSRDEEDLDLGSDRNNQSPN